MKKEFFAHLPVSKESIDEHWKSAIFVFDANTILNLYRYSDNTRKDFFSVLRDLRERIRIPEQAAYEFFRNRLSEISTQVSTYSDTRNQIRILRESLHKDRGHPFLCKETMEKLGDVLDIVETELSHNEKLQFDRINNDDILDEVASIFDGKTGAAYTEKELEDLFSSGATRYAEKIPPGFMDLVKHKDPKTITEKRSVFGDLIVWKQTIDLSKLENLPVVFVTDDTKEDWWVEVKGKTVGPRTELIDEFLFSTNHRIHIYRPEQFLLHAQKHLQSKVSDTTISEIATDAERHSRTHVSRNALANYIIDRDLAEEPRKPRSIHDGLTSDNYDHETDVERNALRRSKRNTRSLPIEIMRPRLERLEAKLNELKDIRSGIKSQIRQLERVFSEEEDLSSSDLEEISNEKRRLINKLDVTEAKISVTNIEKDYFYHKLNR